MKILNPNRRPGLALISISLAILLGGGCGKFEEKAVERLAPPGDVAAARQYIGLLRQHELFKIYLAMDPLVTKGDTLVMLGEMADFLPPQSPTSEKLVGANVLTVGGKATYVNLTFEEEFPNKWYLIILIFKKTPEKTTILGFHVNSAAESLEQANRFTFRNKSKVQYSIFALAVVAALFSLYALVRCARTPGLKLKWLWIIFILVGFGALSVNWTTGQWAWRPPNLQILSAGATRPFYGPWTVSASIPVGAIVFMLWKRFRLGSRAPNGPDGVGPER